MVLIGIDPYPVNSILHGKKKGLFVGKYTVFVKQKKAIWLVDDHLPEDGEGHFLVS